MKIMIDSDNQMEKKYLRKVVYSTGRCEASESQKERKTRRVKTFS